MVDQTGDAVDVGVDAFRPQCRLDLDRALKVADVTLDAAGRRLQILGVGDAEIEALNTGADRDISRCAVRSPMSGRIIERLAVVGEAAPPGEEIRSFAVAVDLVVEGVIDDDRLAPRIQQALPAVQLGGEQQPGIVLNQTEDLAPRDVGLRQGTRVVDTVGAGDAFASVCILGLLENWALPKIMSRAQQFASLLVGRRGATINDPQAYRPLLAQWRDE